MCKEYKYENVLRFCDKGSPYGDFVHSVALELDGLSDGDDLDLGLDDRDLDGRHVSGVVRWPRGSSRWPLTSRNCKIQIDILTDDAE